MWQQTRWMWCYYGEHYGYWKWMGICGSVRSKEGTVRKIITYRSSCISSSLALALAVLVPVPPADATPPALEGLVGRSRPPALMLDGLIGRAPREAGDIGRGATPAGETGRRELEPAWGAPRLAGRVVVLGTLVVALGLALAGRGLGGTSLRSRDPPATPAPAFSIARRCRARGLNGGICKPAGTAASCPGGGGGSRCPSWLMSPGWCNRLNCWKRASRRWCSSSVGFAAPACASCCCIC
jgi:hypothetical protein